MEITFGIYDKNSKDAVALIDDSKLVSIKLLVKCPKRYFYSLYNDSFISFKEQYPQYI